MISTRCVLSTGAVLLLASSYPAAAADQPADDGLKMEEIVVTAQKRAESIQKVPIAMTALDRNAISSLGLDNTVDLAVAVPGLTINNIVGFGQMFIRGVGSDLTQAVDSSIAVHIDGVYVPQLQQQIQEFAGLDRIEVLRG